MNEMTQLEMQLRSWAPRHPSAKLEKRLFCVRLPARTDDRSPRFRPTLLAPAMIAMLLMCVLFSQRGGRALTGVSSSPIVALAMSNQNAAAWILGSRGEN